MSEMLKEARAVLSELTALHEEGWCACQSSTLPARVQASLGDLINALSTPPADDVRESPTVANAAAESDDVDEALWGVIMNAINGTHSAHSIASAVRASFEVRPRGTATPPADDVREALADVQWMQYGGVGHRDEWKRLGYAGASAVMRKFEVRPYGTVTDAEHREAVHRAVRTGIESVIRGTADRDLVRSVATHVLALEASS